VTKSVEDAGIRTVGGLVRKREGDLREFEGLGGKGIEEIKRVLKNHNISLKD